MVTLVSTVVRDAFREAGLIGVGEYPTPNEEADAIRNLQSMILSLPGMVSWTEVEIEAAYTAGENERIRVITTDAVTITVPEAVASSRRILWCCNQITLACEGYDDRAPMDGARVAIADAYSDASAVYYYRADIAQWTPATDLTRDSEMPLNADMDRHLTAMLAATLSPDVAPSTSALVTEGNLRMQRRFDQPVSRPPTYF